MTPVGVFVLMWKSISSHIKYTSQSCPKVQN